METAGVAAQVAPAETANQVAETAGKANAVAETAGKANPVVETAGEANPVAETSGKANPVAETAGKANPVAETAGKANPAAAGKANQVNPAATQVGGMATPVGRLVETKLLASGPPDTNDWACSRRQKEYLHVCALLGAQLRFVCFFKLHGSCSCSARQAPGRLH